MRKKIWSVILTAVLVMALFPATVMADTYDFGETDGDYPDLNASPVVDPTMGASPDGHGPEFDIPVMANVTGNQIKYSMSFTYGNLKFKYSYGGAWNPRMHTYDAGTTGWDVADLTNENTKITVTNDSNYPMRVKFKYDTSSNGADSVTLNDTTSATMVRGHFTDSLEATQAVHGAGEMGDTTGAVEEKNIVLRMYTSDIVGSGGVYYDPAPGIDVSPESGNTKDLWFSLVGKPKNGLSMGSEYQLAGKIHVTCAPVEAQYVNRHIA